MGDETSQKYQHWDKKQKRYGYLREGKGGGKEAVREEEQCEGELKVREKK